MYIREHFICKKDTTVILLYNTHPPPQKVTILVPIPCSSKQQPSGLYILIWSSSVVVWCNYFLYYEIDPELQFLEDYSISLWIDNFFILLNCVMNSLLSPSPLNPALISFIKSDLVFKEALIALG